MSELLVGKQLVVRMQYDDEINVGKGDLDGVLTSVTQVKDSYNNNILFVWANSQTYTAVMSQVLLIELALLRYAC